MQRYKLAVLPITVTVALSLMYFMSIESGSINRADVAFAALALLSLFNLHTAIRWYQVGFITFSKMKEQEKVATSIIDKLTKKIPKEARGEIMGNIVKEEIEEMLSKIEGILPKKADDAE